MNRVQTRIILLIALVGVMLVGYLSVALGIQKSRIESVLREQGDVSTRLLEGLVEELGKDLRIFASDYSEWDELVAFMGRRDPLWAARNLATGLSNFRATGCWLFDGNGAMVWRQASGGLPEVWPIPKERLRAIYAEGSRGRCFFTAGKTLYECRWSPIRGSPSAPPVGYLVVARIWDASFLKQLEYLSSCRVHLGSSGEKLSGKAGRPNLVSAVALAGFDGLPVDMLIAESQSPFLARLGEWPREFLVSMVIFCVLLLLLLSFYLFHFLRNPLLALSRSLEGQSRALLGPLLADGSIFGRLARLVDDSFRHRERLEAEIRDRQRAETQVREWSASLERRVSERTSKLEDAVAQLKEEIEQRRRLEERYQHLAYHDVLTGLPNRTLLFDRIQQALAWGGRHGGQAAVLFIDLDRFKMVNDSLGHQVGDLALVHIAGRLKSCLRASDTVGRIGGDEFIVLLSELRAPEDAAHLARQMLRQISEPLSLEGQEHTLTASIGLALFPGDGTDADALVKAADTAMYQAKEFGRNNLQAFNAGMGVRVNRALSMENQLRRGLDENQLVLHYQPLVDLRTGRISGAEALVRWQHPEAGLLFPDEFIQIAETSGLIVPLGEWVLREACRQNKEWQAAGFEPFAMGVNLSPHQLRNPRFEDDLYRILRETGLEARWLQIEITESAVVQQSPATLKLFRRIQDAGIQISLDDFGTGYSSLSYLRGFPLNKLKIDRSFIREIPMNANDAAITGAVIHMARHLKLKVVAEGVETAGQVAFLRGMLSDEMQGYFFSHPVPAGDFRRLLSEDRRLEVAG